MYQLSDGTPLTLDGVFYVGGVGHLAFYAAPDGRAWSERQIRTMLATGDVVEVPEPAPAAAPDRTAQRVVTISKQQARQLHVSMGQAGINDHYGFASQVVGRPVESLTELTLSEYRRVDRAITEHSAMQYMPL